jgi:hypothetical protein
MAKTPTLHAAISGTMCTKQELSEMQVTSDCWW